MKCWCWLSRGTLLPEIYVLGTMISFQLSVKPFPEQNILGRRKMFHSQFVYLPLIASGRQMERHFLRCHRISGKKWGEPSQERASWCSCLQGTALLVLLPSEKMLPGDWIPGGEKSKLPKLARGLGTVVGEEGKDQEQPRDTAPRPPHPPRGPGHSQLTLQAHANV